MARKHGAKQWGKGPPTPTSSKMAASNTATRRVNGVPMIFLSKRIPLGSYYQISIKSDE